MTGSASFYRRLALATLFALGGCATPPAMLAPHDGSLASRCERAFVALDAAIDAAAVRDAEAARIEGFPAVRVTRFLASFAEAPMDERTFRAWHAQLVDEDRNARRFEVANLPPEPTQRVREALASEGFTLLPPEAFVDGCGQTLAVRDAGEPERRARLLERARVPDDYDDLARAIGMYALTRIAFAAGVRLYERSVVEGFNAQRAPGPRTTYVPGPPPLSQPQVDALVARGAAHPLGIVPLDEAERESLLATFAPVLVVDGADPADRIGRPVHALDGSPGFEHVPVIFGRVAHTRFAGSTHVQLVYTAWFAARAAAYPGDPLAGVLDGVIWRVTLARDGAPLVHDAIHACGCYALFVPTARVVARPRATTLDEQALIPGGLPALKAGERVAVELERGTHQVRGVRVHAGTADGDVRYRIAGEHGLRSMSLPGGGMRSLYGTDGLVAGTERNERFLFWPLGILSAGAMRQWGRHATAFVGRRHFDEAFLLDRYFVPAP